MVLDGTWSLSIQHSTFHIVNLLLFVCRYGRIWTSLANVRTRYNTLYFHHWVELLACLLELLWLSMGHAVVWVCVWIRTNGWHCVRSCLLSYHISDNSSLIFNFNVNRIIWVHWSTVGHWSLWASASLSVWIALNSTHLPCRMQNLLILGHWNATTTSVHCIIHHATFI